MSEEQLFFVRNRQLAYPVFDSDNHMYENTDAFTKFLPPQYEGIVKYIQESDNRTKLAVKDRITRAIPNPTFQRVAPPGGKDDDPLRRRSITGMDAFFDVEPRYKLMSEFGINRALMWPTLASVIEQALPDDPLATHAVIHALNEWMYEHWTFGYEDTVFPTPAIALATIDGALKELEWVTERGARIVYIRPAPVSGPSGTRSFALPEFDPFWEAMQDKDVIVEIRQGGFIVTEAQTRVAPRIERQRMIRFELQRLVEVRQSFFEFFLVQIIAALLVIIVRVPSIAWLGLQDWFAARRRLWRSCQWRS